MGAFGSPKTSEVALTDVFSSLANFTQKVGTWTASANEAVISTGASTIALMQADNISNGTNTIIVKVATSTQAGIYFNATTSASNYEAVTIDIVNNKVSVITTSTGTQATSSIDFTGTFLASTFYTLRVENSGQSCVIYVDGIKQTDASALAFTTGIVGLYTSYNTVQARFSNFQSYVDSNFFSDSTITTAMAIADALIERRTQFKFSTNLASNELYDWFDQEKQEMPYVLSRSFNTLPTFYRLQGFGDANNTMKLRNHPVYSTVKLEENTAGDAATPSWTTRTQATMSVDGDYYVYNDTGVIVFVDNFPRNAHQNLRLTYSYGATTMVEDVAQYATRLAMREILIGYGSKDDSLAALKRENDLQIAYFETYIPEATLLACVGRTTERIT